VTIIEFADLRCPLCERFFTDTEPQIMKEYVDTGKAKFVFRQFAFLGPASTVAANAAECANEQGKCWDFHNYMYKNQPDESDTSMYTTDKLTAIAGQLGMNTDQFQSCLSANKYSDKVNADISEGQKVGVTGTPTIFVNGTPLVGAQPYDSFKQLIDQELAKK
ncbi:MAG: thioredoxin domain-containing protein, partial [Patescibacteria group bacterium]|nr:thioredoxin domain-containing protein [Patescibacteria group bacterium]